mgnify:CR=1 FL=1
MGKNKSVPSQGNAKELEVRQVYPNPELGWEQCDAPRPDLLQLAFFLAGQQIDK